MSNGGLCNNHFYDNGTACLECPGVCSSCTSPTNCLGFEKGVDEANRDIGSG